MIKHNGLLLAFSSLLVGGLPFNKLFVADAAGMHDDNNSVKTITCRSGWNGNSEIAIPHEWMDDGYCDCPFDGKDFIQPPLLCRVFYAPENFLTPVL